MNIDVMRFFGSLVDFWGKLKNRSLYFYDLIRSKMSRNYILSVTGLSYYYICHFYKIYRICSYAEAAFIKTIAVFTCINILKRRFHHIVCLISSIYQYSVIWLLARVYLGCSFQCYDKYENQLMYNKINNDEKIASLQSNESLWLWNCNLQDCQRKYSKRSYTGN